MYKEAENSMLEKEIIRLMDLTSLNDDDTTENISALCDKAITPYGNVAAVCVYPQFVSFAVTRLSGSNVKVATVANFPEGTQPLSVVSDSIAKSIDEGANEIDVVFPYREFLAGEESTAFGFVESCKGLCGDKVLLKVILETGAMPIDKIADAAKLILSANADFLKTSTGKISIGATEEAAEILLHAISASGKNAGLKISGGVREIEQAEKYIKLAKRIMGPDWVTPKTFRIGASRLLTPTKEKL